MLNESRSGRRYIPPHPQSFPDLEVVYLARRAANDQRQAQGLREHPVEVHRRPAAPRERPRLSQGGIKARLALTRGRGVSRAVLRNRKDKPTPDHPQFV